MKVYICKNCQHLLYFENSLCISCQHPVGFDATRLSMITLEAIPKEAATAPTPEKDAIGSRLKEPTTATLPGNGKADALKTADTLKKTEPPKETNAPKEGRGTGQEIVAAAVFADITNKEIHYKFCQNSVYGACNWLIPVTQASPFCQACQLNRIIPNLTDPEMSGRWKRLEVAKHRLVYSLFRLRLPVLPKTDGESGIAFDFMADVSTEQKVLTGHADGVITLNIKEADEAERVRNKLDLGEKYRTLLGHFRHEIGHYYWDRLISNNPSIEGFRLLFGDERKDYGEALKSYYQQGAPDNWADHFISPYASAHPWEDWAETWAHYMHLMDTLETAYSFGISIHPGKARDMDADISKDPYEIKSFGRIMDNWLPLTFAVNSLNRSMGHPDFYPFVISPVVVEKLRFIHDRVNTQATAKQSKKSNL